jgi:hypothetical protein
MVKKDNSAQDHEFEKASRLIKDTITQHFGQLTDPRRINSTTYKLIDIIFITICAVLCGAEDLEDVATYAQEKKGWLKSFLNIPGTVPCYSTFWWTFVLLKPEELERCFVEWVQALVTLKAGENIAIDGKAFKWNRQCKKAKFLCSYG